MVGARERQRQRLRHGKGPAPPASAARPLCARPLLWSRVSHLSSLVSRLSSLISGLASLISCQVHQALLAGSIPVYLGAANVGRFLPAPEAAILAPDPPRPAIPLRPHPQPPQLTLRAIQVSPAEAAAPAALAARLQALARSPALLARHHAWRVVPLPAPFRALWALSWDRSKCNICAVPPPPSLLLPLSLPLLYTHPLPPYQGLAARPQPAARAARAAALAARAPAAVAALAALGCAAEDAGRLPLAARAYRALLRLLPRARAGKEGGGARARARCRCARRGEGGAARARGGRGGRGVCGAVRRGRCGVRGRAGLGCARGGDARGGRVVPQHWHALRPRVPAGKPTVPEWLKGQAPAPLRAHVVDASRRAGAESGQHPRGAPSLRAQKRSYGAPNLLDHRRRRRQG